MFFWKFQRRFFRVLKPKRRTIRIGIVSLLDWCIPKSADRILVVFKSTFGYRDNARLVAEQLVAKGKQIDILFEGFLAEDTKAIMSQQSIRLHQRFNTGCLWTILRSGTVLTTHSIRDAYISRRRHGRRIINLWHGIPIKAIERAANNHSHRQQLLVDKTARIYDQTISASHIDRLAMASCFGLSPRQVAITGLPRFDLLKCPSSSLPADLAQRETELTAKLNGRKMVLYAPTFREHVDHSPFADEQRQSIERIKSVCQQHNLVLAIRPHVSDPIGRHLALDDVLFLNEKTISETNIILRHTAILITDFSSLWLDFLRLNRPIIGFASDLDFYANNERGFLYPFPKIFPGNFHQSVNDCVAEIDSIASSHSWDKDYKLQKSIFFDAYDSAESFTDLTIKKLKIL